MNYTTFLSTIKDYYEDDGTEFAAALPQIITNAEHRIFRDIPDLPAFRTSSSAVSTVQGTATFAQPSDLRSTRSVSITVSGSEVFLEKRLDTYIKDMYPTTTQGEPKYYAEVDETSYLVGPVPDAVYVTNVYYRREPTGLGVSTANTELGDVYEDLLLAACLVYAGEYLHDDEKMAMWEQRYGVLKEPVGTEVQRRYQTEYGVR